MNQDDFTTKCANNLMYKFLSWLNGSRLELDSLRERLDKIEEDIIELNSSIQELRGTFDALDTRIDLLFHEKYNQNS